MPQFRPNSDGDTGDSHDCSTSQKSENVSISKSHMAAKSLPTINPDTYRPLSESLDGDVTARDEAAVPVERPPRAPAAHPPSERNPPEALLLRLMVLEAVEREATKRGGTGKLSYAEFKAIMDTQRGSRLGFVEGWLELGSF